MVELFRAGGFPTWLVVILGGPLLGLSVAFLWRARPRWLAIIRALSAALVFAVLGGVSASITTVFWQTTTNPELKASPDLPYIILYGLGEALTSAAFGFMLLAVVWLCVAVGLRRLDELEG